MLKNLREPVNGLTHLGAALLSLGGLFALFYLGKDHPLKNLSLAIYGISLVLMFSTSAAYHLISAKPQVIHRLRKLDHSAIYLLIAGTYTPICLHFFNGFWRWGLLSIIWGMAVTGVIVTLFYINKPRWISAGIYLIMGWFSVLGFQEMLNTMPTAALLWLLAGGLFFSIGAIIYATKKPNFFPGVFGFHEIWHIFVILGCFSHYVLVAAYIASV